MQAILHYRFFFWRFFLRAGAADGTIE